MYGRVWKSWIFLMVALFFPVMALGPAFCCSRSSRHRRNTFPTSAASIRSARRMCSIVRGYFLYALLFIVFDIETVFLYPWAVEFQMLGLFALIEMFVFVGIRRARACLRMEKGDLSWR